MLKVECWEHFNQVTEFAEKVGPDDQLQKKLTYLDTYAENKERGATRCRPYKDFAPQSFIFAMEQRNKEGDYDYWFQGGLIYHSTHDNGGNGSYPTLAVCVNPIDGWSVHT